MLDFLKTKFKVEVWTPPEVDQADLEDELVNVDETEYGRAIVIEYLPERG